MGLCLKGRLLIYFFVHYTKNLNIMRGLFSKSVFLSLTVAISKQQFPTCDALHRRLSNAQLLSSEQ